MWDNLKARLNEVNDVPMFWAGLTVGLALIAIVSGLVEVFGFVLVTGYQWGYASAAHAYEKGIICAECGDRLDEEMPSGL